MTPAQPTALVEVTQADRVAAADYLGYGNSDWGYCGDVRHGRIAHPLVEAFARHRLAALEEAARVFEEAIAQGYPEPARKVDTCEHGKFGWEGCITCYDEHLTRAVYAIRKAKDLSHE